MKKLRLMAATLLLATTAGLATAALAFDPVIVPAGEGQMLEVLGGPLEVLVRNAQTDGDFSVVISADYPGGGPGPNVIHEDRSETFFVLEGDYTFYSDGKEIKGGPGSIIVNPKGVRARLHQLGHHPGQAADDVLPRRVRGLLPRSGRKEDAAGSRTRRARSQVRRFAAAAGIAAGYAS